MDHHQTANRDKTSLVPVPTTEIVEVLDPALVGWIEHEGQLVLHEPALGALGPEMDAARELAARCLSARTLTTYRWHWDQWKEWCTARGRDWRPDQPDLVAAHLASLAVLFEDDGTLAVGPEGRLVGGTFRPSTVGLRLAALNKAAKVAGLVPPGAHGIVRSVMAGARRAFGTRRVNAKAAATMDVVRLMLDAVSALPHDVARDRALVALDRALKLTPGQIVRLNWEDVHLEVTSASIGVPPPTRATRRDVVVVRATPGAAHCPVAALEALRLAGTGSGPLFAGADGRPMTRQGVTAALARLIAIKEAPGSEWAVPLHVLRDQSLLLTGWYGALRRSNVVGLNWGDLCEDAGEWEVSVRWSKTDQEGQGYEYWLIRSENPLWPCAAGALSAWHAAFTELVGGDPCELVPDQPVFPSFSRYDRPKRERTGRFKRMSGDALNVLVRQWAQSAGYDGTRFGGHSLRAGFITEALSDGKLTISQVQEVSQHKDVRVLMSYFRKANARRDNPTRRLYASSPVPNQPAPRPSASVALLVPGPLQLDCPEPVPTDSEPGDDPNKMETTRPVAQHGRPRRRPPGVQAHALHLVSPRAAVLPETPATPQPPDPGVRGRP
jgi:integrase